MMNSFFKKMLFVAPVLVGAINKEANAQTPIGQTKAYNTITTAVPFLRISPDARAGAMGDVGIATEPDANDNHWNIAKLAMNEKPVGASITYTPWLRDLVPDINLAYLSGYSKFGENKNQAVSASLRYFNLGTIDYTDINAQKIGTGLPREMALDAGYSRKLNENFSAGVAFRYINSNLSAGPSTSGVLAVKPGNAFGTDVGVFYRKHLKRNGDIGTDFINFGAAITNLGSKISYNATRKDFIPTNLGIGTSYNRKIDEFNALALSLDVNKLLVPSPQYVKDSVGNIIGNTYPQMGVIDGLFSSFGDAPGGAGEEFRELMWSIGAEYKYQNQFFARAGYFYEDELKGNRKFATVGLGFKYNVFTLNLAYLVPSGSGINRNPLSNTLRFSLIFDFEAAKKAKAAEEENNSEE